MSRKTRGINPESLDNRERDMDLEDRALDQLPREPIHEEEPQELPAKGDDPEAAIRGRIKALREALPIAPEGSCRACFHRGARAALETIDDKGDLRGQIESLGKKQPPDTQPHSSADFKRGVAAILHVVEG